MITRSLLLCLTIFISSGCWRTLPFLADYDAALARDTLLAALDAWKAGQVPGLTKRQPPIRFVDDDYKAGLMLQDYALTGTSTIIPFADVPVRLILQDRARQTAERNVTYQISLKPGLAVLRSDP